MTQRKEPTFLVEGQKTYIDNSFLKVSAIFGGRKKGHAEILSSALESFSKVERELNDAINAVNDEIAEEARIAREAEERRQAATESGQKLNRILQRVRAFTE